MDTSKFNFAHHKLDAWRVASELADKGKVVADRVPRGYRNIADQLLRSVTGAEALIAEGANRFSPKQKRQRFEEARSEAGEVASHLERLYRYELLGEAEADELLTLANRVCAMLTGLIRHCSR